MERLIFSTRQDIESGHLTRRGISYRFITSYGQGAVEWSLLVRRASIPNLRPRSYRFEVMSTNNRIHLVPRDCRCKFILKRDSNPDMECSVVGEEEQLPFGLFRDSCRVTFNMPMDHEIARFFGSSLDQNAAFNAVLMIVLELPKDPFLANKWLVQVEEAPAQWDNDFRFEPLTNKEEHDFRIVCNDGIFPTNKGALFRSSNWCRRMFMTRWQGQDEHKLEFSLETVKLVATFLFTHTLLTPGELKAQRFDEIKQVVEKFAVPEKTIFIDSLEVLACRQISQGSPSLQDLVDWSIVAAKMSLYRLQDTAASMIVKNYFPEINEQFGPDAIIEDTKKKAIHENLHKRQLRLGGSLFVKIRELRNMTEKVVVAERAERD